MPHYWEAPHKAINERIGKERAVFYSVDADMNDIAFEGKGVLEEKFDGFWSEDGKDYRSVVVENPTWLDLAVLADEAIRATGDYHHSFFEGIRFYNEKTVDGVNIYRFVMGS
jgi:hypothetical protein